MAVPQPHFDILAPGATCLRSLFDQSALQCNEHVGHNLCMNSVLLALFD